MIKDSGKRREFKSGAVRDIQDGKGRCDLMPLDIAATLIPYAYKSSGIIFRNLYDFQQNGNVEDLVLAIENFAIERGWDCATLLLEVSIHFEDGAKKYGENNWQKGLPLNCYIDSASRHYLKWLRGDDDEPHDRAFVWNVMCCAWTKLHKGETE